MKKNPLVAALAALSLAGATFAGQAVQQPAPQQARHSGAFASPSALSVALNGNSVAGNLTHMYLKGNSGAWLAGFGQLTASYNSNYLLNSADNSPRPVPGAYTGGSNFTIALPHASVLVGYDSGNAGFVSNVDYGILPVALGNNIDLLDEEVVHVREAYMTYKINDMFAVKAGKFLSDFGSYDPTSALVSLPAAIESGSVVGVEAVVATNGFHASATGAMVTGASKKSGDVTNDARPNTLILNGGYDMPFQGGTVGVQGSYDNNAVIDIADTDNAHSAAWTIGAHFANNQFVVKGDVLNQRFKSGNKPWVWHGSADYKLGNQFGHNMVVGAYGDYVKHGDRDLADLHWILGAKFGYSVNKYADATAYVQHAAVTKDSANKSNTTAMLALTVKV